MADFSEKMRDHTVRVNGGSGVVIQPSNDRYTYILTAKHVIETAEDSGEYFDVGQITVTTYNELEIELSNRIIDPDNDIAILKTREKIPSSLLRCIDEIDRDQIVHVCGYPETREDQVGERQLNEFRGVTGKIRPDHFVVTLENKPGHDQIVGVSGGGVFRDLEIDIFLCGIESKVEGNSTREFHGKIECIPLEAIDRLLEKNDDYEPILAPHLHSFSNIISRTFQFRGISTPTGADFLKSILHDFAAELDRQNLPTPKDIHERYKEQLLIRNSPSEHALEVMLWIGYLELIIIAALIDEVKTVDFGYLEKNSSQRRFLFKATKENWMWLLRDIYTSDLRGLQPGGIIIVSTADSEGMYTPPPEALEQVIADIGKVYPTETRIDSPMINPVTEFKLYHWAGLHHECVTLNQSFYVKGNQFSEEHNAVCLLKELKEHYSDFIRKQ